MLSARFRYSGRDQRPEAFHSEALGVIRDRRRRPDGGASWRSTSTTSTPPSRSSMPGTSPAKRRPTRTHGRSSPGVTPRFNRHELPPTTPDCVSIDHRRTAAFAPGELNAYLRAAWDLTPDAKHLRRGGASAERRSERSCTHVAHGISHEGFDAEWREVNVLTVEGDVVNRCELFDEADLDAALARFEELSRPAPRLENAASQVGERFLAHFAARDWDAMAEMLAENISNDDRRRVVSAGVFDRSRCRDREHAGDRRARDRRT